MAAPGTRASTSFHQDFHYPICKTGRKTPQMRIKRHKHPARHSTLGLDRHPQRFTVSLKTLAGTPLRGWYFGSQGFKRLKDLAEFTQLEMWSFATPTQLLQTQSVWEGRSQAPELAGPNTRGQEWAGPAGPPAASLDSLVQPLFRDHVGQQRACVPASPSSDLALIYRAKPKPACSGAKGKPSPIICSSISFRFWHLLS